MSEKTGAHDSVWSAAPASAADTGTSSGTSTAASGAASREATSPPAPPSAPTRRAVRVSTVLWGAALLAFAVYMIFAVVAGSRPDPFAWVTGSLIVGGICLVVIGIAAALRRR